MPFSALYLACYEALKTSCSPLLTSCSPASSHLLAGLGAGLLASAATHPVDVVKTRMQLAGSRSSIGVLATVSLVYRKEGLVGFSRGMGPRVLRRTGMAVLAWTVYERMLKSMALK